MQSLFRVVPHVLTLTNLAAGCVACIGLIRGDFFVVPWCLLISALADFLDGFAARAAGVSGPFGRELDSLADMVSFGVSPGLMAWAILVHPYVAEEGLLLSHSCSLLKEPWFVYLALLIPVFSAVRLARFNIEQSDTKHFIGLATPANTLMWFGLFMSWQTNALGLKSFLSLPLVLLPIVLLTSLLLISNVPYFSNKLDPRVAKNWPVWVVAFALAGLPWFVGWFAVPAAMGLYILSGAVWRPT